MAHKKIYLVIQFLIIFLVPITIGSLLLTSPFFGDFNLIDEGQFAAWANHMIHGKLMYRDIYITYGPLFVWPLYFLYKLFGPSVFLTRSYFIFGSQILSLLIVTILINQFDISKKSKILIVLGITLFPGLNIRMSPAYLTIFFLIKSIKSQNPALCFLAGTSSVAAFLISPETGVFSLSLMFLYFAYLFLGKSYHHAFKQTIWGIVGIAIIITLFILWAGRERWLNDYINVTKDVFITFSGMNLPNGQKYPDPLEAFPTTLNLVSFLKYIVSQKLLLYWQALLYMGVFIYLTVRKILGKFVIDDVILLGITLYAFFLYVTLIGKHGGYYLTFAPIVIFSLYFVEKLLAIIKKTVKREEKLSAVFSIIFLSLFLIRIALIFKPSFYNIPNLFSNLGINQKNNYRVGRLFLSNPQQKYIQNIQEFIWNNSSPTDPIFIFTNEAGLYMLVDRVNPARYDLPYVAATIDKRLELVQSLKSKKPKIIIEDTAAWQIDGISNRKRLPEVYQYIMANYPVQKKIGSIIFYFEK